MKLTATAGIAVLTKENFEFEKYQTKKLQCCCVAHTTKLLYGTRLESISLKSKKYTKFLANYPMKIEELKSYHIPAYQMATLLLSQIQRTICFKSYGRS